MHGGPRVKRIVVRDLTDLTNGNFLGLDVADVITRRVTEKADFCAAYTNAIAATLLKVVRIPVIMETDRDAIALGLNMCNEVNPVQAKVVRIKNTLDLTIIWVSSAVLRDEASQGKFEVLTSLQEMAFDERENLIDPQ